VDLRAEPVVVNMPKIEKYRYYTGQNDRSLDLQIRLSGNAKLWQRRRHVHDCRSGLEGRNSESMKAVFQSETELAYILFRTQLFNPADLDNVKKIQAGYHAQTLSQDLKQPAHPPLLPSTGPSRRRMPLLRPHPSAT
jgi:hypothetical protein